MPTQMSDFLALLSLLLTFKVGFLASDLALFAGPIFNLAPEWSVNCPRFWHLISCCSLNLSKEEYCQIIMPEMWPKSFLLPSTCSWLKMPRWEPGSIPDIWVGGRDCSTFAYEKLSCSKCRICRVLSPTVLVACFLMKSASKSILLKMPMSV